VERAKELAYEGKRWYDLLRMGRRNNYANKDKLIEILVENVPSTQKLILASKLANPEGWYFPIFSREIEDNVNLVQNPYYTN
jgi:starch-binding outer membrane protein, SusD/RagB family